MTYDFSELRKAMSSYVEKDILPGISYAVLQGRDVIETQCLGWANREAQVALREDHIFRIFSNTKLLTSCGVLLLVEDGLLKLDDPIGDYLPQLSRLSVLKPNATSLTDVEPARGLITIRHLLSHRSGLSYGLLDPRTLIFKAYVDRKILNPLLSSAQVVDALSELPLAFHPGASWEYSMGTDVLGRLIEVITEQSLATFFERRILNPLGMHDTGFVVPLEKQIRLTRYYGGADAVDQMKPGLTAIDNSPYPGAYMKAVPSQSGGGGLVSTLPDMVTFIRHLLPGGDTLLKPQTIAMMMTNQLPDGIPIRFGQAGNVPSKGFGLGGAVTLTPSRLDPPQSAGEFEWGGIGGTHWWISPKNNLSAVVMTQRKMSFWHPFSFEFKHLVYRTVLGSQASVRT